MNLRIVTLRYSDNLQGFPERALREAVSGKEVLDVREHFFVHGNVPHLTMVLLLGDGSAKARAYERAQDPAAELPDKLRSLYRSLRIWRNERAKRDGVPSYVIMRNGILAEICRKLPRSLSELKEIEGVGEATCARYGKELLGMIPEELRGDRLSSSAEIASAPGTDASASEEKQ